jgi:hypothetical protein
VTPGETVLTMVVGAALASLGGVLAQFLTYRLQSRAWEKDLTKERLGEVWRYVVSGLEFADWVCQVNRDLDGRITKSDLDAWIKSGVLIKNRAAELPVRGTANIVAAGDRELKALLSEFIRAMDPFGTDTDSIRLKYRFPPQALAHREALVVAAESVFARIQNLLKSSL